MLTIINTFGELLLFIFNKYRIYENLVKKYSKIKKNILDKVYIMI